MAAYDAGPTKNGRKPDGKFAPGNPGGPGRPRGSGPQATFRRFWHETLSDKERDAFARNFFMKAMEDPAFARMWLDRIDGKVPDRVLTQEVTTIALEWGDIGESEATDSDAAAAPEPGANRIR